jgi:hypothetical protein
MSPTACLVLGNRLTSTRERIRLVAIWIREATDPEYRLALTDELQELVGLCNHLENWRRIYAGQ